MPRRTRCSVCWVRRCGTPTPCETTYAAMWWTRSGTRAGYSSWTTRVTSRRAKHTVGSQRQYTGTAGRIENAQVAVYLAYAAPGGYTLIDRGVYLPKSWTDDAGRCAAAGVPAEVGFATKLALARRMLARALDADVPAAWATADEAYGGDRDLRRDLQRRGIGYVLAVAKSHRVTAHAGNGPQRADRLAAGLPTRAWNRLSAGAGSKGERTTTGRGSPSPRPPARPPVTTGCWSAGVSATASWRSTAAGHPSRSRCAGWSRWRAPAGASKPVSDRQDHRPGPAAGTPLALLVPAHHPGHARPRHPHRDRRAWTRQPAGRR
jgi:hypothetical protein